MRQSQKHNNDLFLVETNDDLTEVIQEFKALDKNTRIGLDTETTGLDYLKDQIVGVCLAYKKPQSSDYKGFYLPIRHVAHDNLPSERVLKFTRYLIYRFQTVLFNRSFDFDHLEQEVFEDGTKFEIKGVKSHDVQLMAYAALSKTMPSLKDSYKQFCGKEIPTFTQTVTTGRGKIDYNFGNTDPVLTYTYGAYDPIATLELGETLSRKAPYIKKIYTLDNIAAEVLRHQTKLNLSIDSDQLQKFKESNQRRLREITTQCFNITGYSFNLNSNRDKAEALSRFVTLTAKTKSGALSVKAETLENIDHPLAKLMVEYASVSKNISSYLEPLELTSEQSTRLKYNVCAAPTGRLSSGGAKRNSYYLDYNIQAVPKEEEYLFVHEHPELGLTLTTQEENSLGKAETKSGLRRIFNAPEGYKWFTCDYSAQELRIVANMSNERSWIEAFKQGRDIHMEVAKLAFGKETKEARNHAKTVSFGILYGMSVFSLAKRLGCSIEQAQSIVDAYFGALGNLRKWIKFTQTEARKKGIVYTMFGRPRNLKEYFNTSDPKKVAFGERSAVNSPIQGTGSDVLRMSLVKLNNWIESENLQDRIIVANNVYDEINFYIRDDSYDLALANIPEIMRIKVPTGVDLIVEPGIGTSWGTVIDNPTLKNGKIFDAPSIKWHEGAKQIYQSKFA